jgi:SAM-dependent methyltransferase
MTITIERTTIEPTIQPTIEPRTVDPPVATRREPRRGADPPLRPEELQFLHHRRCGEPAGSGDDTHPTFPNRPWRNRIQESFEVAAVVHLLRVPHGGRLLEIGCGRGIGLVPLARHGRPGTLTGLDIDGKLLEHARSRVTEAGVDAELRVGDIRALPFEDASVDVIVDFGTCYHVARPATALGEIERVLAPGGLFVCESPLAQLLAHPSRSTRRRLPWHAAPLLVPHHCAGLWASRVKLAWRR